MANTTVVPISLPKELARNLDRAAKHAQMTRSEFVRDTIRTRVASLIDEYSIDRVLPGSPEYKKIKTRMRNASFTSLKDLLA